MTSTIHGLIAILFACAALILIVVALNLAREPVAVEPGVQAGRPVTEKSRVAVRLKALVTLALMRVGTPGTAQAGAVHEVRLWVALVVGVPRAPVLALQAKVSEVLSGSLATTS